MTFEQAMVIIEKRNDVIFAKIEADKKLHDEQMKKQDEQISEFKKEMKNLSHRFGEMSNRLEEIVSYLVTSNLAKKFDKYDFHFRNTGQRIGIYDGKRTITDIVVLLYDGDKVMAVEVKTRPTIEDVERHILRMEQIQQYPNNLTK